MTVSYPRAPVAAVVRIMAVPALVLAILPSRRQDIGPPVAIHGIPSPSLHPLSPASVADTRPSPDVSVPRGFQRRHARRPGVPVFGRRHQGHVPPYI
nr:unnamed protein product [Digitaria exilis]